MKQKIQARLHATPGDVQPVTAGLVEIYFPSSRFVISVSEEGACLQTAIAASPQGGDQPAQGNALGLGSRRGEP